MRERRQLVDGLNASPAVDAAKEKAFVFGDKEPPKSSATLEPEARHAAVGRAPITTRIRADYATALKRASLKRQLDGVSPSTLQEILEEALEPWLSKHGYLL